MLKISEVAEQLNVSYWTVRRWIKQGKLNVVRLPSGGYRVKREELERITGTNQEKRI